MQINVLIGILGMFLILIGFVMAEFVKRWGVETLKYNLVNLIGALLLVYYAHSLSSIPFLILNGVWALAAVYKLWLLRK